MFTVSVWIVGIVFAGAVCTLLAVDNTEWQSFSVSALWGLIRFRGRK